MKSLREAYKELEARKSKGGNSVLIVIEVLANLTNRKLGKCIVRLPKSVETQMQLDITEGKTEFGRSAFLLRMATGGVENALNEMWNQLEDYKFLDYVGFLKGSEVRTPESLNEDYLIAEFCVELARRMDAKELASAAFYSDRPPYNMMTFFGTDEQKKGILKWMQDAQAMLDVFDPLKDDKDIKAVYDTAMWPHSVWCREGLVSAKEAAYKRLGPVIEGELKQASRSENVKMVEDTHRVLNLAARQNLNNKLSLHARWHCTQTAQLMEDNDLVQPSVLPQDDITVTQNLPENKLNNQCYVPKSKPFSFDENVYNVELLQQDMMSKNVSPVKL